MITMAALMLDLMLVTVVIGITDATTMKGEDDFPVMMKTMIQVIMMMVHR